MNNNNKKMWAYWCFDRERYFHVYPSEKQVRMCSPDGFKDNEKYKFGKVVKVVVGSV